MEISLEKLRNVFEDVLAKRISWDAADQWAWSMMQADDSEALTFSPPSDEDRIRNGIDWLFGCDMQVGPGEYLYSDEDFRIAMKEIFGD